MHGSSCVPEPLPGPAASQALAPGSSCSRRSSGEEALLWQPLRQPLRHVGPVASQPGPLEGCLRPGDTVSREGRALDSASFLHKQTIQKQRFCLIHNSPGVHSASRGPWVMPGDPSLSPGPQRSRL